MRTASGNLAVGINDSVDGDHTGENGPGLVVNVNEDALGIEDGGEEVLDVNAELIRDWRSSCQCEENPLIGLDAPLSWIPLSSLSSPAVFRRCRPIDNIPDLSHSLFCALSLPVFPGRIVGLKAHTLR